MHAEQDCNIKLYPTNITEAGERHFKNNVDLTIILIWIFIDIYLFYYITLNV